MHLQSRNKDFCCSKKFEKAAERKYAKESTEFNYLYIYIYIVSHGAQKENISLVILKVGYIKVYMYLIGVARHTDVTVRYVPRFGGHGSIRFRYNRGKKQIYYARFLFIYFEQTVVNFFFFPSRCENTKYYYMLYI